MIGLSISVVQLELTSWRGLLIDRTIIARSAYGHSDVKHMEALLVPVNSRL